MLIYPLQKKNLTINGENRSAEIKDDFMKAIRMK